MLVAGDLYKDPSVCLEGGILQTLSLNHLEFQKTYSPDAVEEYPVPSVVTQQIRGTWVIDLETPVEQRQNPEETPSSSHCLVHLTRKLPCLVPIYYIGKALATEDYCLSSFHVSGGRLDYACRGWCRDPYCWSSLRSVNMACCEAKSIVHSMAYARGDAPGYIFSVLSPASLYQMRLMGSQSSRGPRYARSELWAVNSMSFQRMFPHQETQMGLLLLGARH
ncbi:hypothetical protein N7471_010399, partial [Penicillium samsonianum]|uniref:uncharacterized protein n=1 Tax=Penicillium samsonianum TaxID=1882272 RepID=UPI00254688F0